MQYVTGVGKITLKNPTDSKLRIATELENTCARYLFHFSTIIPHKWHDSSPLPHICSFIATVVHFLLLFMLFILTWNGFFPPLHICNSYSLSSNFQKVF
jgi:hypothetical protein